jgi:osmotically-inducible protein OsmY
MASRIAGVAGVSNKVRVVPLTDPELETVKQEIQAALVRHARRDARNIDVQTDGPRVVLQGCVESWAEAEEAETAARSAPGVTDVENHLHVIHPSARHSS